MKKFVVPTLVCVFGMCWLLAEIKIFDASKMIWTLGLLFSGVLLFVYFGISRSTFVLGSMLITGSGMSILRYNELIKTDIEIPLLVFLLGIFMFINHTKYIPAEKDPIDDSRDQT